MKEKNGELNCLLKIDHNIVQSCNIMQCDAILIECQLKQNEKSSSQLNERTHTHELTFAIPILVMHILHILFHDFLARLFCSLFTCSFL